MSICRVWLHNISNALMFWMSGEQIRLQFPPKLFGVNCWIVQMIRQWIPDCWSSDRKCTGPKRAVANSWNWQLMTSGRSQMLATRNFGDWHTVVGEVPWSSVAKTTMDCHSKLVLHSLRNNQPVQVVMDQSRQTMLFVFSGPFDQTGYSILNMLQLVHDLLRRGRQNRVTIVDARCDKGVVQCFYKLNVQRARNTSQLPKAEETCLAYIWNMTVKTKIRHNSHTKKSNIGARFYHIVTKL